MIARVTLEIALRKEFDYLIPSELASQVDVGSRVQVPFGARKVLGCVTAMAEESAHANLRPILKVIGAQTLVTPKILKLARWIGEYYCCPPEIALKSVLPDAVRKEQAGWRERLFVRALPQTEPLPKLPKRQQEVYRILEERKELPLQELIDLAETTAATVRSLEDKGLVTITTEISERDPYAHEHILPSQPLPLNPQQARALERIIAAMDGQQAKPSTASAGDMTPVSSSNNFRLQSDDVPQTEPKNASSVFLLHGVTGSGKTEVYLQALAHALEQGKGAIVLVPEISLTPQTVERFKARFSSGPLQTLVAVLHSHLSAGERHDEWHKIRQGRARIVIGARSAIFAPVDPLGLIIVDEEHEHTYKQEESPRYHARDVAIVRGRMEGATVVLGSATPSMESFYNCSRGKYILLEMLERVDAKKMPLVRVVDMRQAMRKGKSIPIYSPQLKEAIQQRLERKEQTILFLNRRGYSTSLQCPLCGFVAQCPNCSVSLTYHRRAQILCCHVCGHTEPVPSFCPGPKCGNPDIRYAGLGTEKVEDTLLKLFPHARIKRMDSDTLKKKDDYRRILGDFRLGKIDILVGTQMIAKGLHFPNVTLVGIVYADMALHLADFRAGERTFQLLTQVAGRAGRGDIEGEVFVQSFTPFHPAIQYARRHDFAGFYEQELEFREQLKYPPVSRVAMLTLKGRNEEKVKLSADHLRRELEKALAGIKELIIAGPAPAPLARAESLYRYQIMLRARQMSEVSKRLAVMNQSLSLPEDVSLSIDIDPVNLA
ncbi:replication restart helicase PriA [Pedosphaera parvula]|uniref:Replication restart protein PriA n=1 Tax=Pedosphaera parvula (strain Ellin514) TaxID=320771 RepID=B9XLJ1_PEDPL|nr:primosomal protein N' [Pedosphaera parvula]EEF59239.1 primosomal protein N' [Pedosphaera parvula Ellin514]